MGKFRARLLDPEEVAQALIDTANDMEREMREAVVALGEETELIYAGFALKRSGRMARGIRANVAGGSTVLVTVHARDPKTGYDYVGVTRWGHSVKVIVPSGARRPASVVSTRRRRARVQYKTGPRPALRLPSGEFRYSVRGFQPAGDWADKAWPVVKAAGEATAEKLGSKILTRFM